MASLRWGVLSVSRIGSVMLEASRRAPHAQFVAIASRDARRAASAARLHNVERSYDSYQALLDADDVDALYIPLPNALHVEWAVRALRAGKHVLSEKPLSRHPTDVIKAFDAAERAGKTLAEAFQYRYHPTMSRVRDLVSNGAIGALAYIKGTLSFMMADGDIRSSAALDGGALMDTGCYSVSAARFLAGEPERVYAEAVLVGDVDLQFVGTMRMPNGVIAQFDCGLALPRRDRLEVVGTAGAVILDDPWICRESTIQLRRNGHVEMLAVDPDGSYDLRYDLHGVYAFELETISRMILDGKELPFDREDAVAQARVLEALFQSAASQAPIELS